MRSSAVAHLQGPAERHSILCGFRTYALIKERVMAEAREPLARKGASRPVEAWEILELLEDHAT